MELKRSGTRALFAGQDRPSYGGALHQGLGSEAVDTNSRIAVFIGSDVFYAAFCSVITSIFTVMHTGKWLLASFSDDIIND